ncbi:MAG TPA: divalent-cation tolerance protein CutA [Saprospiraceae bacterium]|nr:divalent-cation tolerance protein CutA [Saprospiraceae bacterium]
MITILYVTHPNEAHAKKISNLLVEEKCVACVNIFPIRSIYPWQGKMNDDHEYVSLLKTLPEKKTEVIRRIESLHEYKVPCIIQYEVYVNPAYKAWLTECLK